MKAVIAHREGEPRVVQLPDPTLGERTVLVRVTHCALMLPEEIEVLATVRERSKGSSEGVPLGGMASGIIDDVGARVSGFKAGLRVAAFGRPYVYHAASLSVPENMLVELPKKVNHEEGAFAGQGAMALHAFRSSGALIGETMMVFGAGMSGCLIAQVARAAGVQPILVDASEHRLTKARNVGITHAVPFDRDSMIREIDKETEGEGADVAVVTAEAEPRAVALAAMALRPGGRIVFAGTTAEALPARVLEEKEISVRFARTGGAGHGDPRYEEQGLRYPREQVRWTVTENMKAFLTLVSERKVQISPLITERIPLERAPYAYEKIQRAPATVIGGVLTL